MRLIDAALRLVFFLPLMAGALLLGPGVAGLSASPRPVAAAVFACGLAYARLAAFLRSRRGVDEAMLGLEALPFLAWTAMRVSGLGPLAVSILALEWASLAAVAYLLEEWLLPARRGFLPVLGFLGAALGMALALAALPPFAVLAPAALALVLLIWTRARSAR